MTFKIVSNVPVPPFIRGARKYPFNEMKPGDSFLVDNGYKPDVIRMAAESFGRQHGWKFTVRKTPEGHRCWRIS